jgi:hypothetical protein
MQGRVVGIGKRQDAGLRLLFDEDIDKLNTFIGSKINIDDDQLRPQFKTGITGRGDFSEISRERKSLTEQKQSREHSANEVFSLNRNGLAADRRFHAEASDLPNSFNVMRENAAESIKPELRPLRWLK